MKNPIVFNNNLESSDDEQVQGEGSQLGRDPTKIGLLCSMLNCYKIMVLF